MKFHSVLVYALLCKLALVCNCINLIQSNEVSRFLSSLTHKPADCEYTCPGEALKARNTEYVPFYNGCGTNGLFINFNQFNLTELTTCCNRHDICYSGCTYSKTLCDLLFLKCLNAQCSRINRSLDQQREESMLPKLILLLDLSKIYY
jgi:hypothetical protein